jgi:hypothetical protein
MKNEFQCLNLVLRQLSIDPTPHGYSPPNGHSPPHGFLPELANPAPSDSPLPNREVEVEDVVVLPDAQSALNEVGICPPVHGECWTDVDVTAPHETPLTQNHPSKCHSKTLAFAHDSIPLSQCNPYFCL